MKKIQTILTALAAFAFGAVGMHANALPTFVESLPWNYSMSTLLMSQYYGTWVGGIFYDGPMSFTDILASHRDRSGRGTTRVDLSVGQKLDSLSFNRDGGNEYDLVLGHTHILGTAEFPIVVDYALTYLATHDLGRIEDDVVSNAMQVNLPGCPIVEPYANFTRFDHVGKTPGSGWFVYAGAIKFVNTPFSMDGTPLKLRADYRIGYSGPGLFGKSRGLAYHRLEVALPLAFDGGWSAVPAVVVQLPGKGQEHGHAFAESTRVFATLAISRKF